MNESKFKSVFIEILFNCFLLLAVIVVCINLLANMIFVSKLNEEKSMAVIETQNIAEIIKASKNDIKKLEILLETTAENDNFKIYYNENFKRCDFQTKKYTINITYELIDNCMHYQLDVSENEIIYELEIVNYMGKER